MHIKGRLGCRGVSGSAAPLVGYKRGMADAEDLDSRLRTAMFAHLSRLSTTHPDGIPSEVIKSFVSTAHRCG